MAGKEIIVKKYVVRLSGEEREQLAALTRKGRGPAQRLMGARILLKADASEAGEGWSYSRHWRSCAPNSAGRASSASAFSKSPVDALQVENRDQHL